MARKGSNRTRWRVAGALILLAILAGIYAWWSLRQWQPDRAAFPMQGVEIGSADGVVDWNAFRATGADFAYLDASASAFARDPQFIRNLEAARAAMLEVGAVHVYDPCQPADRQAANFVTVVPRDAALLPPAIDLSLIADACPVPVSDAAVESELMTFINQVETHTGKPAILKLSPAFQDRYQIAARIDRNLWLTRNRVQPDYGGRPWTLWTANDSLDTPITVEPVRWVVVQP